MNRTLASAFLVGLVLNLAAFGQIGAGAAASLGRAGGPAVIEHADPPGLFNLSRAVIVRTAPGDPGMKAAAMLRDEIERRSGVRLSTSRALPSGDMAAIVLSTVDSLPEGTPKPPAGFETPDQPEGYAIWVDTASRSAPTVYCVGRDARGALFAAGRLIRLLRFFDRSVYVYGHTRLATAPRYAIRGHQLGYRDLANSYDAWDVATYEQYIRDLILFGTNAIELIPSLDPQLVDGPVMKEKVWDMNVALADLIASYGLDVMFWTPVLEDVSKPDEAAKALDAFRAFFQSCKRIDVVLVPGGDPGENSPEASMPWIETMASILHEVHPDAELWVSNQAFEHSENDYFFRYLEERRPAWLTGLAFGPWIKITIEELRKRTPEQYVLRHYPDVTHCVRCQYPMPDWDRAFAHTLGREPICPRPLDMAHIHNRYAPLTLGFVTYSDGIHDDLNKIVWNAMAWDPDADVKEVVREYAKVFFGDEHAATGAQGLLMLEENWRGPILENAGIEKTLGLWKQIAEKDPEALSANWRLQMYLFRAYYDAYVKAKAKAEAAYEEAAYAALKRAKQDGVREAANAAGLALAAIDREPPAPDLRNRIEDLGLDLLHSIGFQLSVEDPFRAKNRERGAVLDWLDQPLNDRPWLEQQLRRILTARDEAAQWALLEQVLDWENPGPGGFYDDLGNPWKQPHLVLQKTWKEDPGFVASPQCEYSTSSSRLSWQDQAQTLFGTPLVMRYEGLDPNATYRLRVTYAGRFRAEMRLVANGLHEIHGPLPQPVPVGPVEFDIPVEATRGGTLELAWELIKGRGCQVAEVWLIRN